MSKIHRLSILFMLGLLTASCATPTINQPTLLPTNQTIPSATAQPTPTVFPQAQIVRHPEPVDLSKYFMELTSIPKFDIKVADAFQVDLRSRDLTKIDMSSSLPDLMYATFDSKTQWPASDKMPIGFDWQKIMEISKDPGLGIRALHEQGITGKGVGIGIIDQTLFVDHTEYKDRIRVYEEAEDITGVWLESQMHGATVASIAVGKTVGVAPNADLYFIATRICSQGTYETTDFTCLAKSVRRMIEINKSLPKERKIRVISMSVGWEPQSKGYDEIVAAVNDAKAEGIFVSSVSLNQTYGWNFRGLGRNPLDDPNDFRSYKLGWLWQKRFFDPDFPTDVLFVPMDSRTTASPTGSEDYVFYSAGSVSWMVPYLAGMYALAAQVKPDIAAEEFWNTALKTGRTIQLQHDGKEYQFGVILDPQGLIETLKNK